jgi:hypothetical protein
MLLNKMEIDLISHIINTSDIQEDFVKGIVKIPDEGYDFDFKEIYIEIKDIAHWLDVDIDNLKKFLSTNHLNNIDYTIRDKVTLISYNCFKCICEKMKGELPKKIFKYLLAIEYSIKSYEGTVRKLMRKVKVLEENLYKPQLEQIQSIVYIIDATTNPDEKGKYYKIGVTDNPASRLIFYNSGSKDRRNFLYTIETSYNHILEKVLKAVLYRFHYGSEKNGEIYKIPYDDLKQIFDQCNIFVNEIFLNKVFEIKVDRNDNHGEPKIFPNTNRIDDKAYEVFTKDLNQQRLKLYIIHLFFGSFEQNVNVFYYEKKDEYYVFTKKGWVKKSRNFVITSIYNKCLDDVKRINKLYFLSDDEHEKINKYYNYLTQAGSILQRDIDNANNPREDYAIAVNGAYHQIVSALKYGSRKFSISKAVLEGKKENKDPTFKKDKDIKNKVKSIEKKKEDFDEEVYVKTKKKSKDKQKENHDESEEDLDNKIKKKSKSKQKEDPDEDIQVEKIKKKSKSKQKEDSDEDMSNKKIKKKYKGKQKEDSDEDIPFEKFKKSKGKQKDNSDKEDQVEKIKKKSKSKQKEDSDEDMSNKKIKKKYKGKQKEDSDEDIPFEKIKKKSKGKQKKDSDKEDQEEKSKKNSKIKKARIKEITISKSKEKPGKSMFIEFMKKQHKLNIINNRKIY